MLEHLFTWKDWDQVDTAIFQYYDVVLKQQIGDYPKGFKVECIIADFDAGTISIDGKKFKLIVTVGDLC